MYRNVITTENTEESHKEVITSQIPDQLAQIGADVNVEPIKSHFMWVLSNDFYKDELTAEQITEMESYLPSDYADSYEDLPEQQYLYRNIKLLIMEITKEQIARVNQVISTLPIAVLAQAQEIVKILNESIEEDE